DEHLALAEIYRKTGRLVPAASQAELAAAAAAMSISESTTGPHPRWAGAYSDLGHAYQQLGRLDLAVAAYEEALRIDPSYRPAQKSLDLLSNPVEDVQHTLWRNLGGLVALVGYSIDPGTLQAGEPLHVSLWWKALGKMDKDYSVFVHAVGPDGRIQAQQDRILLCADHPTSEWDEGQIAREEYQLELAPDSPPGGYIITVGIYYWETGERLP
ncbi:MAG: tetratricopeptide repeat protein, partial [Anaerolineae bacterium]|nr:tetratricopeptide repeat protein [Anaerolineae bacterium]NIN94886.1 tetratricopeptide repeat protein [Anaerolineae bacterium]NIQ77945.1 tetratricopeptide repeat protein [Anaerolineae bacterium]